MNEGVTSILVVDDNEINKALEQRVEERTTELQKANMRFKEELAQRIRAEEALRQRNIQFRDFNDIASDWFWEMGKDFRYTFVSQRINDITSFRADDWLGKTRWELVGADPEKDDLWRTHKADLEACRPFRDFHYALSGPDGRTFYFKLAGQPVFDAAGGFQGYRGVGADETAEVVSGKRLREVESQLLAITKRVPGIIFRRILKVDGTIEYPFVSDAAQAFPGYQQGNQTVSGFHLSKAVHEDDYERFQQALDVSGKTLTPVNIQYRVIVSPENMRWVHCKAQPQRVESGDIVWDGVLLDITDRKNLEMQLAQAQKLESVGQLAAGIAHEINTPTQFASDNIQFLQEAFSELRGAMEVYGRLLEAAQTNTVTSDLIAEVDDALLNTDLEYHTEEVPKAIEQAMEGLQRISNIVSAMKEFSHPGADDKEPVDINTIIKNTLTVARNEWKYVAELKTDFTENLPLVPCYRDKLGQVFLNLIVNAAHAIGGGVGDDSADCRGTITINTVQVGTEAEIRISDTGPGVPEPLREKIFDPFFTTKGVGKGTGQGLAIARSVVVDKHGGSIALEPDRGKGATFVIRLPLGDDTGTEQRSADETYTFC